MNPALRSLAALFAGALGAGLLLAPAPRPAAPSPPVALPVRLAVLVVFDQMRGDLLARWRPLFGPNGFARLQRDGAWFTNCHYPYGVTTTGPGHASVLTGACPDAHGIVNNDWTENGQPVYCAGSERYELVPPAPTAGDKQATPPRAGTPERLRCETVADVLKETYGARAKVFGLSLKDRSAVLPTGRRPDGAYWFYGTFGTSTYYTDRVHPWVARFNQAKVADRWFGRDWTRFRGDVDYDRWSGPGAVSGDAQGGAFRHPITGGKAAPGREYYEALVRSPFGNELLLELAKVCVREEGLGADDVPDLLVLSFSSNDLIGHTWGPDSQEVLDVTLRADALVAELLDVLDARVGKNRYLFGLTADHGVCPLTQVSRANGTAPDAARVSTDELARVIDAHLTKRYPPLIRPGGTDARWVESIQFPWVQLNARVVAASGRSRAEIAAEAATAVRAHKNVMRAFTRAELSGPFPAADAVANRMKRSFDPTRCGDLAIVLTPYSLPGGGTGTTHGTPFNYDTHAPLLVYGPGVRGGARTEPTAPQALASIFAKWLNVRRPNAATVPIPATLE